MQLEFFRVVLDLSLTHLSHPEDYLKKNSFPFGKHCTEKHIYKKFFGYRSRFPRNISIGNFANAGNTPSLNEQSDSNNRYSSQTFCDLNVYDMLIFNQLFFKV